MSLHDSLMASSVAEVPLMSRKEMFSIITAEVCRLNVETMSCSLADDNKFDQIVSSQTKGVVCKLYFQKHYFSKVVSSS